MAPVLLRRLALNLGDEVWVVDMTDTVNCITDLFLLPRRGRQVTKKPKKALRFQRWDEFGAARSNA